MRVAKTLLCIAVLGGVGFALVQVLWGPVDPLPDATRPNSHPSEAGSIVLSPTSIASRASSGSLTQELAADKAFLPPLPGDASLQTPLPDLASERRPTLDRATFERRLADARDRADQGEIGSALAALSKLYWETRLAPLERAALIEQLDAWSRRLFFSKAHDLEPAYVVQSGDSLARIGKRYQLSWEYLARINDVRDPRRIRAGQRLKVVPGPFEAVVDLSDFELTVMLDGRFVRRYDVGIGKDGTTPLGTFRVEEKEPNPKYWGDPVTEADDPENPLGERWIGIGNSYGIHGTIEPESIGQRASAGCIRMLAADVEEVYDLLVVGSRVRIQP